MLFSTFALAFDANADVQLITNGGFETGLTGWTVTSSAGSGGSWFADTNPFTPLTGHSTVGPFSGTGYAVTDQVGPGVNALSQDYTVPGGTTSLTLTFDMFINDWAPSAGDESMSVLILGIGGNPVTGAGTTLISTDTLVTAGVPNPYIAYDFAIAGFVTGDTYVLDFRETDTVFNMNVGLDDVSLDAAVAGVPEPSTIVLLLGALGAIGVFGRRRLGAIRHLGKPLFVLAAIALLSQPAHARNRNAAYPVVPRDTLEPGHSRPYAWRVSIDDPSAVVHGPGQTNCGGGPGQNVCYYLPADVNTAYTTNFIVKGNGGGGTIVAIVDAYFNSQTESDLLNFTTDVGLPACTIANGCLTIVGQTCGAPPPQPSPITSVIEGWFQEEDLDVQWVHSIAPNAKILLVIANSSSNADLFTAVQCAKANADVVTDSWGALEFSGQGPNSDFSSAVPILFSAGDIYAETQYPCTSPNVTCVGGTHLLETATSYRNVELVWDETGFTPDGGTGGGCSPYESEPLFQVGFSTCGSQRGVPDIAAIADEYTGVLVYLGSNAGGPGLFVFGGTSLASPVTAAIVANIDASRASAGKTILGGSATSFNLAALLYEAAGNPFYHYRFYDVTTGTGATAGWDALTGLGVTLNPALTAYLDSLP